MTEIAVRDFDASVAWYRDRLGLRVELLDAPNRFALLRGSAGGRLALKGGPGGRSGVVFHFEVGNLDAELRRLGVEGAEVKVSPEGYRRAIIHDPDGNAVTLFQFLGRSSFDEPGVGPVDVGLHAPGRAEIDD